MFGCERPRLAPRCDAATENLERNLLLQAVLNPSPLYAARLQRSILTRTWREPPAGTLRMLGTRLRKSRCASAAFSGVVPAVKPGRTLMSPIQIASAMRPLTAVRSEAGPIVGQSIHRIRFRGPAAAGPVSRPVEARHGVDGLARPRQERRDFPKAAVHRHALQFDKTKRHLVIELRKVLRCRTRNAAIVPTQLRRHTRRQQQNCQEGHCVNGDAGNRTHIIHTLPFAAQLLRQADAVDMPHLHICQRQCQDVANGRLQHGKQLGHQHTRSCGSILHLCEEQHNIMCRIGDCS